MPLASSVVPHYHLHGAGDTDTTRCHFNATLGQRVSTKIPVASITDCDIHNFTTPTEIPSHPGQEGDCVAAVPHLHWWHPGTPVELLRARDALRRVRGDVGMPRVVAAPELEDIAVHRVDGLPAHPVPVVSGLQHHCLLRHN